MLSRRNILKIVAASPLFLHTSSLLGRSRNFQDNGPASIENFLNISTENRIAIFSSPCTKSHALAHFYLHHLFEQEDSSPLFYNDELKLGDFETDKVQANNQRKQFKHAIKSLNDKQAGVFSFRNLFEDNADFVLAQLKRLNFTIIYIEPTDIKASALNWSLASSNNLSPTALWNNQQIYLEQNSITLERKYLEYYIKRHSRSLGVKEKLKGLDHKIINQNQVENFLNHLGSKAKSYMWSEVAIQNPEQTLNNLSEVQNWLRLWRV